MIQVKNIHYHYGSELALNEVSLSVEKGEIFGLIGPDGAGKTTLIRIMTTLLLPQKGNVTIAEWDVVNDYRKVREHMGYMPGRFSLYEDLTISENLNLFADLFGSNLSESYELISEIYDQIEPFKNRRAGKLSGGMKQKLALCCALIHSPLVLFLDEPTTGVDPVSRSEFWDMLGRLKKKGVTIVVSTPYMDEAMRCDRVALMYDGNLMRVASPDQIISEFAYPLYKFRSSNPLNDLGILRADNAVRKAYLNGEFIHFTLETQVDLSKLVNRREVSAVEFVSSKPSIEDCFLDLMKAS